ncbi:MAG: hypothetical protein PHV51_02995 [Methanosarcinaceae archaeon]|nr:hypothetical protein [Methanosarcinaceae archaeon]MDD4497111.1 hypothetical protein [Methanosarcinaceae archaeon]
MKIVKEEKRILIYKYCVPALQEELAGKQRSKGDVPKYPRISAGNSEKGKNKRIKRDEEGEKGPL